MNKNISSVLLASAALFISSSFSPNVQASPVCVSAPQAEVRAGPGKKFPIARSVKRFTPFNQIASKPGWKQVEDFSGARFWIASVAVSNDTSCVVIKTRSANLRREPASTGALITGAARYTAFKKVDRDGEWVQLEDANKTRSWVHESNIWYPVNHMKLSFN